MAVDITTNEVYWTERLESKIFKAPLRGANAVDPVTEVVSLDLVTPEVLVLDWIGRAIYWVDSYIDGQGNGLDGAPRIERVAMDGSNRTSIVTQDLAQPRAIVVDHPVGQESGCIYWTDAVYVYYF